VKIISSKNIKINNKQNTIVEVERTGGKW
jgi:hypothetical protein